MASIEVGPSGGTGAGVNEDGSLTAARAGTRRRLARRRRGRAQPPPPDPKKIGIWRSDDGGKTWRFMSNDGDRWMYYSQIRIDPDQPADRLPGRRAVLQDDRRRQDLAAGPRRRPQRPSRDLDQSARQQAHPARQRRRPRRVATTRATTWDAIALMPLGQFYAISADMRKPYYVCGGLQDNGSWCGPSAHAQQQRHPQLRLVPRRRRRRLLHRAGSDRLDGPLLRVAGRQHQPRRPAHRTQPVDPPARPAQAGRPRRRRRSSRRPAAQTLPPRAVRRSARSSNQGNVVPPPPAGTNFRFFWSTPFILSPHNPRTIYLGARAAVPLVRPRRHVDGVAGPDAQHRPQRPADHGRGRQGADGVQARRRRVVQQHRHDQRVVRRAGHPLGRAPTTATCR